MAADIDHGVERRRAADHPAARPVEPAAVEMRLRLGAVAPVVAVVHQVVGERGRHVDLPAAIPGPGLQHQHAGAGSTQPLGQHAAGGAGTHHDIVERPRRHAPRPDRPALGERRGEMKGLPARRHAGATVGWRLGRRAHERPVIRRSAAERHRSTAGPTNVDGCGEPRLSCCALGRPRRRAGAGWRSGRPRRHCARSPPRTRCAG